MSTSRRSFLGGLAATAAALAAAPGNFLAGAVDAPRRWLGSPRGFAPRVPGGGPWSCAPEGHRGPSVPDGALDQEFWRELRGEFLIPEDEAFFNTGTLGSQPREVLDAVVEHMTHVARDIARWDYKAGNEVYFTGYYPETRVREKLAARCVALRSREKRERLATVGLLVTRRTWFVLSGSVSTTISSSV